ncbi:hypothetical protein D9758_013860 [Tetrapyrgos nigripes]|uniref:RING-type domain-containing protein n=1 Tax=Tetrapyrgos nigripes TaxID=182062 RepID=A0A8H5CQA4_9AGAR|nr:hypothetical protein D9758_013860 [Tetrapyrgos nigripes]
MTPSDKDAPLPAPTTSRTLLPRLARSLTPSVASSRRSSRSQPSSHRSGQRTSSRLFEVGNANRSFGSGRAMDSDNSWTRLPQSLFSDMGDNVSIGEVVQEDESGHLDHPVANLASEYSNGPGWTHQISAGSSRADAGISRLSDAGTGLLGYEDTAEITNPWHTLSVPSSGLGPGSAPEAAASSRGIKRERSEENGIAEDGPSTKRLFTSSSSGNSHGTHPKTWDQDDEDDTSAIHSSLLDNDDNMENTQAEVSGASASAPFYPIYPSTSSGGSSSTSAATTVPLASPFVLNSLASSSRSAGFAFSPDASKPTPSASLSFSESMPGPSNAKGKDKVNTHKLSPSPSAAGSTAGPSSSSSSSSTATTVPTLIAVARPRKDPHPEPISVKSEPDASEEVSQPSEVSYTDNADAQVEGEIQVKVDTKGKGKGKGRVKSKSPELDESTLLSAYTCPVCFCPPTNATLTPCGHICCGSCLFSAVKSTMRRGMGMMGGEGGPRCPVCRAVIPGWDGKGGGVIGLKMQAVFSFDFTQHNSFP